MPSLLLVFVLLGYSDDLESVLRRHEHALERIHSLEFRLVARRSDDGGQTWKEFHRGSVRKQGRKLRARDQILSVQTPVGVREGSAFEELLFTPEGRWSMTGIDPEHPPKEPVSWLDFSDKSGRPSGRILPAQPFGAMGYKDEWLFRAMISPGAYMSLREHCNLSPRTTISEVVKEPGKRLWQIELREPSPGKTRMVIQVAEEFGYMISSKVVDTGDDQAAWRVVEFEKVGDGLYFPKLVRTTSRKKPQQRVEFSFSDIKVNQPIPSSEFTWRFPEGMTVADETGGREIFHIWGKNGPAMTFQTADELNRELKKQMNARLRDSAAPDLTLPTILGLVTLLLIALILIRRRLRVASSS